MRVLVTGGGGFLGRAIIRQLLAKGHDLRAYQRSPHADLSDQGVAIVQGDITDADALSAAVNGCDAVIHTAAKAGVWGTWDAYYAANVTGTENVVAACLNHGVEYLIHTSTPSVVYSGESFEGADESLPYGCDIPSPYPATKAQAERAALLANGIGKLRTCALRPHLIWGVGDPHLVPRVLAKARTGRLRIIGDGTNRVDLTHVDNAAHAHLCALEALQSGKGAGRAYFISDDAPVALWPWINALLTRLGNPPVTQRLPLDAARAIGGVLEFAWWLLPLPGEPAMTRFVATELAKSHWFDISAAKRDLNYAPTVDTAAALEALAHAHEC